MANHSNRNEIQLSTPRHTSDRRSNQAARLSSSVHFMAMLHTGRPSHAWGAYGTSGGTHHRKHASIKMASIVHPNEICTSANHKKPQGTTPQKQQSSRTTQQQCTSWRWASHDQYSLAFSDTMRQLWQTHSQKAATAGRSSLSLRMSATLGHSGRRTSRFVPSRTTPAQLLLRHCCWRSLKLGRLSCSEDQGSKANEKRQLWVRPIEWLKPNFASCVAHVIFIKLWKTSEAVLYQVWKIVLLLTLTTSSLKGSHRPTWYIFIWRIKHIIIIMSLKISYKITRANDLP